ncbi:MAG: TetR/AcrR family transcriptional regulator [Lachnospiraceae bacterium]|nr:TetR/AcrR family transcriptional regulator [Lachnospiraceae bacterium]
MAFSKGKRIEDETSKRIIDLAVNIGCKEGTDALTVTRICRELNCDRRVIYNRFRDLDEINLLVAKRCNEELIVTMKEVEKKDMTYCDNFKALMKAALTYIYERNAFFQYYTALYSVTEEGIQNEILQALVTLIENGKDSGDVKSETNSKEAAESIWMLMRDISGVLATNVNYKYQEGMKTMMYGVDAIMEYMKA